MKKFRFKRGFTLTEMLISVMLLGFVSAMVAVMTSAILNSTVMMREVAQAEILGSEALDNLQGQIRVAHNVQISEEGELKLDLNATANKNYRFALEDGRIVLGEGYKYDEGKKELVRVLDSEFEGALLFSGSSYGELSVTKLNFEPEYTRKVIVISVEISYGTKALWNGSATVKPLNGLDTLTLTQSTT